MSGPIAFIAMLALTPAVIHLAHKMEWVALPKADRWHERPTALMGGVAIFLAATVAVGLVSRTPGIMGIWLGASLMFMTGLVDDLKNIKPATKLVAQIIATGLLLYSGYTFAPAFPIWISFPLTFLWVIGITNAINLLDNMDGLAAGIAAIASLFLASFSWLVGSAAGVGMALATAGAAAGFLVFNFKPARIFMGDSGSLFLGYMIASLSIVIQAFIPSSQGLAVYLVSAAVLAVPIFDTTLVTMIRPIAGRSVSQGGRDHTSHRLVFLGFSERRAVVFLYGISIVSGLVALVFYIAKVQLFYSLVIFMVVGLTALGVFLAEADVYSAHVGGSGAIKSRTLRQARALIRKTLGSGWKVIFAMFADLLLVVAAFILAYHLRFEQGMSSAQELFVSRALPIVIAVKLPIFYASGLYKSVWRYAGAPELVLVARATMLASIAAFVVLSVVHGFSGISRGVAVIDWMIVAISISCLRFGVRAVPQYLSSKRSTGSRVILYGAGSAGMLALSELRQNNLRGMIPVGFLDDNVIKTGRTVQGLQVFGTLHDLENVVRDLEADAVIITTRTMSPQRIARVEEMCKNIGIDCLTLTLNFDAIAEPKRTFVETTAASA